MDIDDILREVDPTFHSVPREKRDGFTAFTLPNDELVAPKGEQFWLANADVSTDCTALDVSDGCPCP